MPTSWEGGQPPHRRWTGMDIALIAVATVALIFLEVAVWTMSSTMRAMFAEFDVVPPPLTRMALSPASPAVVGFVYVALVLIGVSSILEPEACTRSGMGR